MTIEDVRKPAMSLPDSTRVVIVGGGIIGCSIAYHLTRLGWSDVIVLERDQLGCGTTWHSHGLIGLIRASPNMTRLALRTTEILSRLETETDLSTGFRQNGTVILSPDAHNLEQLRRLSASMRGVGLELHEISVDEAQRRWPLAETSDAQGAFFMPQEGQTNPLDTLQVYAKAARQGGAKIVEKTEVLEVLFENRRAKAVRTAEASIDCEFVVNCTGMWARAFESHVGRRIPLLAVEQCYIVTETIEGIGSDQPMLRDYHNGTSARADAGQLTIGANAPYQKPWGLDGIPANFSFDELPDDWDLFEPMLERMMERIPILQDTGIRKFLTGPESVTPDSRYLLGPLPGVLNYFVAAGMSGVGVGSSGGIGEEMANWIVDGSPSMDLSEVDVQRTMLFESNLRYLSERVGEGGGALFDILWPSYQPSTARGIRQSPLHARLSEAHAQFRLKAGWEVADWFADHAMAPINFRSFDRYPWFDRINAEQTAVEVQGGLSDLSEHCKFFVQGVGARDVLSALSTTKLPNTDGKGAFVSLRTSTEVVACCVDICRLDADRYLVIGDAPHQTRLGNLLDAAAVDLVEPVIVTDMTAAFAIIKLFGEACADVIDRVCSMLDVRSSFADGDVVFGDLGYGRGWVYSRKHGELSTYELIVSTEYAASLFDFLRSLERPVALALVGNRARTGLAIELGIEDRERVYPVLQSSRSRISDAAHVPNSYDESTEAEARHLINLSLNESEHLLFGNEVLKHGARIIGRVIEFGYGIGVDAPVCRVHVTEHVPDVEALIARGKLTIAIGNHEVGVTSLPAGRRPAHLDGESAMARVG